MTLLVSSVDHKLRAALSGQFKGEKLIFADTSEETELHLLEDKTDILVYDIDVSKNFTIEALGVIRKMRPRLPIIVLAEADEFEKGRQILGLGIFYMLLKPVPPETIKTLIESALCKSQTR